MNERERRHRDAKIVRLYEDGICCARIATMVKLQPPRVRRILSDKGYDLDGRTEGRATPPNNSIWERDRVDLRIAIAQRARIGARTRLNEINASSQATAPNPQVIPTNIGYAHFAGRVVSPKLAAQNVTELLEDRTSFPQAVH